MIHAVANFHIRKAAVGTPMRYDSAGQAAARATAWESSLARGEIYFGARASEARLKVGERLLWTFPTARQVTDSLRGQHVRSNSSRRMKVLHVTPVISARLGGAPRAVFDMCIELAKRGVAVTCFTGDLDELGSWLTVRGAVFWKPPVAMQQPMLDSRCAIFLLDGQQGGCFLLQWLLQYDNGLWSSISYIFIRSTLSRRAPLRTMRGTFRSHTSCNPMGRSIGTPATGGAYPRRSTTGELDQADASIQWRVSRDFDLQGEPRDIGSRGARCPAVVVPLGVTLPALALYLLPARNLPRVASGAPRHEANQLHRPGG